MKELPNGAMKSTPTPTRRRRRRRRSMRRRRPTSGTLIRRPIHLVSFLIAIHLDIFIFILVWVWFVFYNLKKKQLLNLEMSCTGFLPSWLCWLTKASDWLFSFWPFFFIGSWNPISNRQRKSSRRSSRRRDARRDGAAIKRRDADADAAWFTRYSIGSFIRSHLKAFLQRFASLITRF